MHQNTLIIICGPTAVGKTAVAVQLAQHLRTEIISADSRQCFKELNIGVAKPSLEELSKVHHYFINSHSIHDEVNAAIFEEYALKAAEEVFKKQRVAVVVGGTGLYIKALTEGMDEMPPVDAETRQKVYKVYKEKGLVHLQEQVAEHDPEFWAIAERENPQRLMRALEIVLSSGKSVTKFRQGAKENRPFNIVKIGLELPREELYHRINTRVDVMIEKGLAEEVSGLLAQRNLNALQTVGYRELFDFFDGHIPLAEAITDIKTNTRRYAKRQLTWFKKDTEITWMKAEAGRLLQMILEQIPIST